MSFFRLFKIVFSCVVPVAILSFGPEVPMTLVAFAASLGLPVWVFLSSGDYVVTPVSFSQSGASDDDFQDEVMRGRHGDGYIMPAGVFTDGDAMHKILT